MQKRLLFLILPVLVVVMVGAPALQLSGKTTVFAQTGAVGVPTSPIPEAGDFATTYFRDSWDMSDLSDVAQYLNGYGRHPSVKNQQVLEGIFQAISIGDYKLWPLAAFYPLFPGLPGFMQIGRNLGSLHPIDPAKFQCLSIAMKVKSTYLPGVDLADGFRVMWYAGQNMEGQGVKPNGGTVQIYLYPEAMTTGKSVVQNWKLYQVDLRDPPNGIYKEGTAWSEAAQWMGLEINPTLYKDITFEVDWIRLTSCEEDQHYLAPITWPKNESLTSIWARPVGTDRSILIKTGIKGESGTYSLDTKGFAPGSYLIGLGRDTSCCDIWSSAPLQINRSPIVEFTKPSSYSGEDYASAAGKAWDMTSSSISRLDCISPIYRNGSMQFETLYPALLPSHCKNAGGLQEADPKIFLSMPGPLENGSDYRYLTFHHYINGQYPLPVDGMMGRWMWAATNGCTRVSADIPFEVGWHTYSIDLFDSFNGMPVESAPDGCTLKPWWEGGAISAFRFDPNENWTGNLVPAMVFDQKLDWMRLTKIDSVRQGSAFPFYIQVNKNRSEVQEILYYYTDDLDEPAQNRAVPFSAPVPSGRYRIFLPAAINGPFFDLLGLADFTWDTSQVGPGEYYICARASDGYNTTIYCSDAPVRVTPR
jgi:hypothetical protein